MNKKLMIIVIFCLSVLPFVSHMIGGDLILLTNIKYSLDPSGFIKDSVNAWDHDNFGQVNGNGFTNIIQSMWFVIVRVIFWFNPKISQAVILGIFNFVGALGFLFFIRNHFKEKIGMFPILAGSIFFLFNGYTLTYLSSAPNFVIVYLVLPWQLFLFERCLQQENFKKSLLPMAILVFVNQAALWVNLVYFFVVFFVQLFLGFLYVIRSESSVTKVLAVQLIVWALSIAMMSWWLFPQIYSGYADPASSANTLSSEGFYNGDSGPFNVFRNLGYWGFFGGNNGEPYYSFSKYYRSGIVVLATLLPIILIIGGLLFKVVRKNINYLAWLLLLLLIFPFVGGINVKWPTANLMHWFFGHVPMFSIFRNTHKWMALAVFSESILLAFLCQRIFRKNKRIGMSFCAGAIIILSISAWPFFSGEVVQPTTVVKKIPDDWLQMADRVNHDDGIQRIMLLPDQYGEIYNWQEGRIKIPGSLGGTLFSAPVVYDTCRGCLPAYSERLVNFAYKNFGSRDYDKFIGQIGVSNILQRDDYAYDYYHYYSPEEIRNLLSAYPSVELTATSGNLSLYKIDKALVNPEIYSPSSLVVTDTLVSYLDTLGSAYEKNQSFYIASSSLNKEGMSLKREFDEYGDYHNTVSLMDDPIFAGGSLSYDFSLPASAGYTIQALSSQQKSQIFYSHSGNDLVLETKTVPYDIRLDGRKLFSKASEGKLVIPGLLAEDSFVKVGADGTAIFMSKSVSSGTMFDVSEANAYNSDLPVFKFKINDRSENVLKNGDFSDGLWNTKVGNCRKTKENADIGMELRTNQGEGQMKYLRLWAKDDSACTASHALTDFDRNSFYIVSLDYRHVAGGKASLCVWDGKKCSVKTDLNSEGNSWKTSNVLFAPDQNSTNLELYLYADKGKFDETVNDYAKVRIVKVSGEWLSVGKIKNPMNAASTTINLEKGRHEFVAGKLSLSNNIFKDGSFESDVLGEIPADCQKQSTDAKLGLRYVEDSTDGKHSIELSGDKDKACISSGPIDVSEKNDSYLISYDYKIIEGEKAQICVWDGKQCAFNKIYGNANSGWNHVEDLFKLEDKPKTISIYIYSPDQKGPGRVRYDNVMLRNFDSGVLDSYDIYSKKEKVEALDVKYTKISPIHYLLNISKIPDKDSVLVFQQTFHPDWQLACNRNGEKIGIKEALFGPACTVGEDTHFVANGFANGWFLNRKILNKVKLNEDGSFSLDLYFTLNRWFYIGLIVSILTLIVILSYLVYFHFTKNHNN